MAKIPIVRTGIQKLGPRIPSLADQTQPYYKTREHREWAKEIVRRAYGRCEKCGRERNDDGTRTRLFADHIVEVKDGGTWTMSNGQALCGRCHTVKTIMVRASR